MTSWDGVDAERERVALALVHVVAGHEADLDPEALSGREGAPAVDVDADVHAGVLVAVPGAQFSTQHHEPQVKNKKIFKSEEISSLNIHVSFRNWTCAQSSGRSP